MPSAVTMESLTDDQLSLFADLIYDRTGIRVSPQKKTLLSNRLRRRLRETGIPCFTEYFEKLKAIRSDDPEWDQFLQEITTHETYLFRDPAQWDWFSKTYLPEIQAEARKDKRRNALKIWSAASSTGDEAYTIACCIADKITNHSQWNVQIIGSDVGIGALNKANEAVFSARAMKLVSDSMRRRFFSKKDNDHWAAKPVLTQWTKFKQHNLLDTFSEGRFDLVFVKNVFIYFDADSKRRAFENVHRAIAPGGFLVTGPAEGMSNLLDNYERIQPWLHRKKD